jgi:predicted aspartyl protease
MQKLLAIALFTLGFALPAVAGRPDSTPFRLTGSGGIVVPVMLDAAGPFPFLLDTGSNRSAVSEELARELGAVTVGRSLVVSPAGEEVHPVVSLPNVSLGSGRGGGASRGVDVVATVTRREDLDEGRAIEGLIGQDVLASLTYTVDFRKRIIEWHFDATTLPPGATTLRLEREEGRFLVELPQRGAPLRLVPDSGVGGLVLFDRPGADLPRMDAQPGRMALATTTGSREVQPVRVRELRVGSLVLRNQRGVVIRRAGADAPRTDGLLPLQIFARVTFNGPAGVMIIEER